jgi:hypothetical protein
MPNSPERKPSNEVHPELVRAFFQAFLPRTDCYPMQLENGAYITVKSPLTQWKVMEHLQGKLTLGAYALDLSSYARWLCLDADEPEQWEQVKEMAHQLEMEGVFSYLELSRRGGHCWLFTPPLLGKTIRKFGKGLLEKYNLGRLELYPKQDMLKTGTGSLVRLPFGIHRKTGKRYHFIAPDGEPLAPTIRQQIALLATPARVPDGFITQMLAETPVPTLPPRPFEFTKATISTGETVSSRIKAAISVLDFVGRSVALDERGKGLCPFHDDQVQSFQVNREGNFWSCYAGCGGGSIIDFWMRWRAKHGQDNSFTSTVKELASMLLS